MKKSLFFLLIICFLSCSSDDDNNVNSKDINATWYLTEVHVDGKYLNENITYTVSGEGSGWSNLSYITFNEDNSYSGEDGELFIEYINSEGETYSGLKYYYTPRRGSWVIKSNNINLKDLWQGELDWNILVLNETTFKIHFEYEGRVGYWPGHEQEAKEKITYVFTKGPKKE